MKKFYLFSLLALSTAFTTYAPEAMQGGRCCVVDEDDAPSSAAPSTGSFGTIAVYRAPLAPEVPSEPLYAFERVADIGAELERVDGTMTLARSRMRRLNEVGQSFWRAKGQDVSRFMREIFSQTRRSLDLHKTLKSLLQQHRSHETLPSCEQGDLPVPFLDFLIFVDVWGDDFSEKWQIPENAPLFQSLRGLRTVLQDGFKQHFEANPDPLVTHLGLYSTILSPLQTYARDLGDAEKILEKAGRQIEEDRSTLGNGTYTRLRAQYQELTRKMPEVLALCNPLQDVAPRVLRNQVVEVVDAAPNAGGSGMNNPIWRDISNFPTDSLAVGDQIRVRVLLRLLIQKGLTDELIAWGIAEAGNPVTSAYVTSRDFPAQNGTYLRTALTAQLNTPAALAMSTSQPGRTRLDVMGEDYTAALAEALAPPTTAPVSVPPSNAAAPDRNSRMFRHLTELPENALTEGGQRKRVRTLMGLLIQNGLTDQLIVYRLATQTGTGVVSTLPERGEFPVDRPGEYLRRAFMDQLNTPAARPLLDAIAATYDGQISRHSAPSVSGTSTLAIMPPAHSSATNPVQASQSMPVRPISAAPSTAYSQISVRPMSAASHGYPQRVASRDDATTMASFATATSFLPNSGSRS